MLFDVSDDSVYIKIVIAILLPNVKHDAQHTNINEIFWFKL